jgi:cytochrome c-type biogenesis protein CcmH
VIRRLLFAILIALVLPTAVMAQTTGATGGPGPAETSHPPIVPSGSGVPTAATLNPEREEMVRRLASELRCPVCQGLSVQDSPTELSMQMKAVIRGQLEQGKTPDEVRAYFVARYGEWILLKPEASGFNLVIYFLPLVMLLAGGVWVAFTVRRWRQRGESMPPLPAEEPA